MDFKTIKDILDIAQTFKAAHKEHHTIPIAVTPQADELGVSLRIHLDAAFPPRTTLVGQIHGFWLGALSAVDKTLFRDSDGNFATSGLVYGQTGTLYIPYGAAELRGAGLYTLEIKVLVPDPDSDNAAEVGQATYKIALSTQPPWRRVEFFWPLIKLCMAVIRVDDEVLPLEIRGLREYLTAILALAPEDMPHLRTAMKDAHHGDLKRLLDSVALRIPGLAPEELLTILCEVARLDGFVNAHEYSLIRQIAAHLSISPNRCTALVTSAPITALAHT